MLGVVGKAVAATSFLPAVLTKGVLEEQEEGLPVQDRRVGRTFCSHFDWQRICCASLKTTAALTD